MKNNTALTVSENNSGFLALKEINFADIISEEMDGLTASFERVKIPAGGATVLELPTDDPDEPESVKEFSAVILLHHPINAYYKTQYQGGSNPPDCGSFDGVNGAGDPGGSCHSCPLNQFGSGGGSAKACKNRQRLYLLREGEAFPMIMSLPTGSIKGFSRYVTRLLSKGNKTNSVVTRFSLKKAVNGSGIAYSQAQFAVDRKLTEEEYALIRNLTEQVRALKDRVGFEAEEAAPAVEVDPATGEVIEPLA